MPGVFFPFSSRPFARHYPSAVVSHCLYIGHVSQPIHKLSAAGQGVNCKHNLRQPEPRCGMRGKTEGGGAGERKGTSGDGGTWKMNGGQRRLAAVRAAAEAIIWRANHDEFACGRSFSGGGNFAVLQHTTHLRYWRKQTINMINAAGAVEKWRRSFALTVITCIYLSQAISHLYVQSFVVCPVICRDALAASVPPSGRITAQTTGSSDNSKRCLNYRNSRRFHNPIFA